jgi:hypothetical protein
MQNFREHHQATLEMNKDFHHEFSQSHSEFHPSSHQNIAQLQMFECTIPMMSTLISECPIRRCAERERLVMKVVPTLQT